jgi:acyl carrier protein
VQQRRYGLYVRSRGECKELFSYRAFHAYRGWLRPVAGAGTYCIWVPVVPTSKASLATLLSMPTEDSSTVTREAVTQHIVDLIGNDGEIADLTPDLSLQSQGLDSLKVMSLVFKIEEHYDILLDEDDADDLRTVELPWCRLLIAALGQPARVVGPP